MAKPIFLIGIPKAPNTKVAESAPHRLSEKMKDYHVIIYWTKKDDVEFNCFYEKDIDEKGIEEIKEYIKNQLK